VDSTLWFVLGVLALIVGLSISIGLHEWGHYAPAKKFGVAISQFMVGFGPTLWSTRKGDTEFGIKAIPLGGYVAMQGMFAPSDKKRRGASGTDFAAIEAPEVPDEVDESRSFYRLSIPKRIVIMLGGPVMNLLIAFVLYAILLAGFGLVQPSLTVGSVSECVVAQSETPERCLPSDPVSPGFEAGVLPGDTIVSIDGVSVDTWLEMTEIVRANPGVTLDLAVERDGVIENLRITPMLTERYAIDERGEVLLDDGEPVFQQVGFVGIGSTLDTVRQPLTSVPQVVWGNIEGVARVIVSLPQRMVQVSQAAFGDDERDPNGPISVVGVGRIAGEIASIDAIDPSDRVASFLALLASLNIALFVFNLVPLLPLDGGHVAVALIDGVRRRVASIRGQPEPRPMDPQRLMPLTLVVVAALISMSVLLMYADIVNPISLIQ